MLFFILGTALIPSRNSYEFLEQGSLAFGRWVRQAPYLPDCGVIAKLPQASRLAGLSSIEQYSAVELFRGTMVCHSVVAYRADSAAARQQISFTGDAWLDYVPIRMPDTICLEERVPPGAAAVLINQSHTFRDLFLPIDSGEKLLFDSIDGRRNIGQILQAKTARFASGRRAEISLSDFGTTIKLCLTPPRSRMNLQMEERNGNQSYETANCRRAGFDPERRYGLDSRWHLPDGFGGVLHRGAASP